MKAVIVGIRFSEIDFDMDDAVARIMITEFNPGITKWLLEARRAGVCSCDPRPQTSEFLSNFHLKTTLEHALLAPSDQQGEEENGEASGVADNPRGTTIQAVLLLLPGTIMAVVFADPLVDGVDYFCDATRIPTFFISFVVLPLVTNTSEAVSAVIFASRKRIKTASLTFSEVYFPFRTLLYSTQSCRPYAEIAVSYLTRSYFLVHIAAIWSCDDEQLALPVGVFGPRLP